MKFGAFFAGITAYGKAFSFIGKHRLHRFYIIPGIFGILVFLFLGMAFLYSAPAFAEWVISALPEWLQAGFFHALIQILIYLVSGLFAFILSRYVVMILLSPVMSRLSEITEEILSGRKAKGSGIVGMIGDIFRSLRLNIRNFFRQLFFSLLLSLIPVLNVASPFTLFLLESYYSGFNLMDYTMERKRMGIGAAVKFVRPNRMMASGLGMAFSLLMLVPVIGWMFAPVLGTVAATMLTLEELEHKEVVKYDSE